LWLLATRGQHDTVIKMTLGIEEYTIGGLACKISPGWWRGG